MEAGFILTARSFDQKGVNYIRLDCIGGNGHFVVIKRNPRLLFFIKRSENVSLPASVRRVPVDLTDFDTREVDALYFRNENDYRRTREKLRDTGVQVFESDIYPAERFLMEKFLNRSLAVDGECVDRRYINPSVKPAGYTPFFSTLSIDIETGSGDELFCIALHFRDGPGERDIRKVLMIDKNPGPEARYEAFPSERELLVSFFQEVQRLDPDLIIGWNVIGFDLDFIHRKAHSLAMNVRLGRSIREPEIIRKRSGFLSYDMDGRIVLDGIQSLRIGFFKLEDYSLQAVGMKLLGRGKTIGGEDRMEEISKLFREDKESLSLYNLNDAVLVSDIFQKTGIVDQLLTRSLITGLPLDRVGFSVAAFDHFMLPRTHRKGFVAPDITDIRSGKQAAGGLVFTSEPGLYDRVAVFDFRSLYPSIIATFHIDPVSRLLADENSLRTPAGIRFSRDVSVLGEHILTLFDLRKRARENGDTHLSQAIKILMNSYYGVMGTTGCRFYNHDLPTAITATGQWVLTKTADYLRGCGHAVIYGDTDSIFLCLPGEKIPGRGYEKYCTGLTVDANRYLRTLLADEFGVKSFLVLEFEKLYDRFFLPPMRFGGQGSRKRYAGRLARTDEIEFRGMEFVRSDWTVCAKKFQKELFTILFDDRDPSQWMRSFIRRILDGQCDEDLVFRKRLTKPEENYTRSVPPHVKAARRLFAEGGGKIRRIEYVITREGPEPVAIAHGAIDYGFYIEHQLKPIADNILPFFGLGFDQIIHGRQLEFFE